MSLFPNKQIYLSIRKRLMDLGLLKWNWKKLENWSIQRDIRNQISIWTGYEFYQGDAEEMYQDIEKANPQTVDQLSSVLKKYHQNIFT